MIIEKKKVFNSIKFVFYLFLVGGMTFMGILMVFGDNADLTIRIFGSFLLLLSLMGIFGIYQFIFKLASSYPEFELTQNNFVVHDNLKYYKIPWGSISKCELYTPYRGPIMILLKLNDNSRIKGNLNWLLKKRFKFSAHEDGILLSLEFADIKHSKLIDLVEEKIAAHNSAI